MYTHASLCVNIYIYTVHIENNYEWTLFMFQYNTDPCWQDEIFSKSEPTLKFQSSVNGNLFVKFLVSVQSCKMIINHQWVLVFQVLFVLSNQQRPIQDAIHYSAWPLDVARFYITVVASSSSTSLQLELSVKVDSWCGAHLHDHLCPLVASVTHTLTVMKH